MNIKTDEYIAQERIQQEKIQHEQVKPEQAEQYNKAVPSKSKPIIQYKDSIKRPLPTGVRIEVRDEEWVVKSCEYHRKGYSNQQGKLHYGSVPGHVRSLQ